MGGCAVDVCAHCWGATPARLGICPDSRLYLDEQNSQGPCINQQDLHFAFFPFLRSGLRANVRTSKHGKSRLGNSTSNGLPRTSPAAGYACEECKEPLHLDQGRGSLLCVQDSGKGVGRQNSNSNTVVSSRTPGI